MEGTLEELRRISNCPEGATFSQLGLRKSVEGYGHAQRERLGGSAGCLFAHDAPHFAQWHVVLQTAFSRAPSCISAAIRATGALPVPRSHAVRRMPRSSLQGSPLALRRQFGPPHPL